MHLLFCKCFVIKSFFFIHVSHFSWINLIDLFYALFCNLSDKTKSTEKFIALSEDDIKSKHVQTIFSSKLMHLPVASEELAPQKNVPLLIHFTKIYDCTYKWSLNNNAVFVSFNRFYREPIIMTKYGCFSALANILLLFPQFCITVEARDTSSAHRLTTDTMNDRMTFI